MGLLPGGPGTARESLVPSGARRTARLSRRRRFSKPDLIWSKQGQSGVWPERGSADAFDRLAVLSGIT